METNLCTACGAVRPLICSSCGSDDLDGCGACNQCGWSRTPDTVAGLKKALRDAIIHLSECHMCGFTEGVRDALTAYWSEALKKAGVEISTPRVGGAVLNRLQALYDSEINFKIGTFWDGGFDWALGDKPNGWKAGGNADSLEEAVRELSAAACHHYPESTFAKALGRVKVPGAPGPAYCCEPDCPNDAEFEVIQEHPDIHPAECSTHACTEHVGHLLGSPVKGPDVPSWRVVPLVVIELTE